MATMNLDDVPQPLGEFIAGLSPGEGIVLTKDGEHVATLTRIGPKRWPCKVGTARDTPHRMAPDFDAPLDDFRESL
jgi:antitoxin (DNA-binding transcriptional repressor) of toxin-antitoxin stability system